MVFEKKVEIRQDAVKFCFDETVDISMACENCWNFTEKGCVPFHTFSAYMLHFLHHISYKLLFLSHIDDCFTVLPSDLSCCADLIFRQR